MAVTSGFVTVGAFANSCLNSETTSVCIGAAQPNIVFTNPQNFGVKIIILMEVLLKTYL
jgi:hypothetical protein